MKEHLDAWAKALADGGMTEAIHVAFANKAAAQNPPYIILSAPSWGDPDDLALCGPGEEFSTDVRAKVVAGSGGGALIVLGRIRAIMRSRTLTVPSRFVEVRYERSEFVAPDTSVTLTNGNHPTQGVDTYRMHSQPV